MRLGKELATGVIEVPAATDCISFDEPSDGDSDELQSVERASDTWRFSEISEQGALIRSR